MKRLLLVFTAILMISCSTDESNNVIDIVEDKNLLEITGSSNSNIKLAYQEGKLVKGFIWGSYQKFQVLYNAQNKVVEVITQFQLPYDGLDFDLTTCTNCSHYQYSYENNKLMSIKKDGYNYIEFSYLGDIVEKEKRYHVTTPSINNELREMTTYQYNSNDEITHEIITTYSSSIYTNTYALTFDDKVNPFYIFWKNTNLYFLDNTGGFQRKNLMFYPNNVIKVEEGSSIEYDLTMTYNIDDYPTSFIVNTGSIDSGTIIYN